MLIKVFIIYFILINIASFGLMGLDKIRAIDRKWRISERTLFLLAASGGFIGIYAAMYTFRHKTRHRSFTRGIPLIGAIWIIAILGIIVAFS